MRVAGGSVCALLGPNGAGKTTAVHVLTTPARPSSGRAVVAGADTFVSPALLPGWLGTIAEWNPLSATVASCRMLFGNPGWRGDSWAAEHALALAIGWPLLITLVFLPLSARRYRRLGG
ncbi:ATP-binding cassette domain-containing protein [Microbispora bryophytorum]|uniref:ATP-binding cassette domain-containing protein n=1 Tax=Microbispora bryophytorum TaxID=1460882 RepID=UPI001663FE47|nr:ATP-binding cassette domain-containing protein [Microbispora bryophytorum]MBD3134910.1 ATP-binding cassette domain-containing protein [Microbispora bryophytorum]